MKHLPLISIITPSYNSAPYIKETIESVLQQTYPNWEMIIVDDCSTDDSKEIVKRYIQEDKRIKLISNQENIGVAQSRNRAIEEANGDYIALLDSDDIWVPNKLEKQIELMEEKNILMSFSAYTIIDEKSETIGHYPIKEKVTYSDMLKTSSIGTLTTIYNANKLGKFYFEEIGHEDYVYKLNILKQIDFAQGIKEPLAKYRRVQSSLSSNKIKAALWQWKIYRDIEKIPLIQSIYYFINYAYNGLRKYR
jgi:glycosyltransferase involved in cell wall biosynthesis